MKRFLLKYSTGRATLIFGLSVFVCLSALLVYLGGSEKWWAGVSLAFTLALISMPFFAIPTTTFMDITQ